MKRLHHLFLPVFMAISVCIPAYASPEKSLRIINGSDATSGEFPWIVALLSGDSGDAAGDQFCGGSLIDESYVLTAAHCVLSAQPSDISVIVGETDLPRTRGNRIAAKGFAFPPADPITGLVPDIALIKLQTKLIGNPTIPLLPPGLWDSLSPPELLGVLGWGTKDPEYNVYPVKLQKAKVKFFNDEQCSDALGRLFREEIELCAGIPESSNNAGDGVDTCYGDSGGPLYAERNGLPWLLGATSWGFKCASKYPGVYAEAQSLYTWLTSHPDVAPNYVDPPTISGTPVIGETLTCIPPQNLGDTAADIVTTWYREISEEPDFDFEATGETYTVQETDLDYSFRCIVTGTNPSGTGVSPESDPIGPVTEALLPDTPEPTTEPTSEPAEPPTEVILGTVRASRISTECHKGRCRVVFKITNGGGYQFSRVVGSASEKVKTACTKGKKNCTKTVSKKIRGTSLGGDFWSFQIRQSKTRTQKLTVTTRVFHISGAEGSSIRGVRVNIPRNRAN